MLLSEASSRFAVIPLCLWMLTPIFAAFLIRWKIKAILNWYGRTSGKRTWIVLDAIAAGAFSLGIVAGVVALAIGPFTPQHDDLLMWLWKTAGAAITFSVMAVSVHVWLIEFQQTLLHEKYLERVYRIPPGGGSQSLRPHGTNQCRSKLLIPNHID